jgi:glycosyltransferase involved in cell wall biosynthesis
MAFQTPTSPILLDLGSRMRLAIFHNLPSGGAKRHTAEQVRELARRGYQMVEFAPATADLEFCSLAPYVVQQRVLDAPAPVSVRRRIPFCTPFLNTRDGLAILRETDRVNRLIAREIDAGSFDLAFVKDCQIAMNPFVLRHLETPSLFQCHHGLRHYLEARQATVMRLGIAERLKAAYYAPARALYDHTFAKAEKRNLRSATRVMANSRFSQKLLLDRYGIAAGLLYPGINTGIFRPRAVQKKRFVLCVGALIYSKGYRFLISALARVPSARRPTLFVAANSIDPAEEATVRTMAVQQGVDLHIENIQDDERLATVYSEAAVFVYAPMQEALGMAPLEAMASGTPVLAVGEGGVCETVQEGVTGQLVRRDPVEFAEQLEALLQNESERLRMGEAGVQYVRHQWTWDRAVTRLESAFRELRQ